MLNRTLTVSQLYSLAQNVDTTDDRATNRLPEHFGGGRNAVSSTLREMMTSLAQASGITETEAWAEAAQHWIAQRQQDLRDLATPAGRELAHTVRHIWQRIDDQLRDLRG
jgi:hypothetical protein